MPVSSPLAFPGYTGAVLIGSELDQPANVTWNGMLDDVAVFAGALTESQIATVMSGDFSAFIGGPAGIVSQPQSQTRASRLSATFSVGVDGQPPFQYQWYFNGTNKLSSASNPTATNATLVSDQCPVQPVGNLLGSRQQLLGTCNQPTGHTFRIQSIPGGPLAL